MTRDVTGLVRWGIWLTLAVLAWLMLAPLSRFIDTSASWLDYPYPRPGSEGLILYESLLVRRGGDIYAPITPERFISGPYPPVFYWLAAWSLPSQLPDLDDPGGVTSIFRPGRSIALLSTLVAAALVALLVIFEGGCASRGRRTVLLAALGGVLGGALLLTLPQVLVWATRFRGDMLMIALTTGGLLCVAAGAPPKVGRLEGWNFRTFELSNLQLALAVVFFALAFFTKQTAFAGPLAAAAYLLLRDWRSGLRWCALMLLAVAVPFAILDLATGHWFYLKMVVYHSLPFSRLTFSRLLQYGFWESQWPLLLVAGGYTVYRLGQFFFALRTRTTHDIPLLIPLFVLASLAALPTGAVVGADHNHLLMPGLALCTAAGAFIATIVHRPSSIVHRRNLALALPASALAFLLLMGYVALTSAPSTVGYGPDLAQPSPAEQEQLRKIASFVRQSQGRLYFSDDPGILGLAGKETPYDDPFTISALAQQGRWDESVFRAMLREHKFALLVLSCDVNATLAQNEARAKGQSIEVAKACRADTFTPGVLGAIQDGYNLTFRDVFFTYTPKN